MPRFRIKSLLILSAAIAVWFSTFARYTGADDVQHFMILAITIGSGAAAVSAVGAKRAFWGGFCATMWAVNSRTLFSATPRFSWLTQASIYLSRYISQGPASGKANMDSIQITLAVCLWLVMAALIGMLCTYIYKQNQPSK